MRGLPRHAVMTQQRVDVRLAATERLERIHRRTAAAHFENLAAITRARFCIQHRAVGELRGFLERGVRIG